MARFIGDTSAKGFLKPGGASNNWDLNIIRAVVLLHELSHSSGAYYHRELKDKQPYLWSKPVPYSDRYGQSSLDVLIFNTCFSGWRWASGEKIQSLDLQ